MSFFKTNIQTRAHQETFQNVKNSVFHLHQNRLSARKFPRQCFHESSTLWSIPIPWCIPFSSRIVKHLVTSKAGYPHFWFRHVSVTLIEKHINNLIKVAKTLDFVSLKMIQRFDAFVVHSKKWISISHRLSNIIYMKAKHEFY